MASSNAIGCIAWRAGRRRRAADAALRRGVRPVVPGLPPFELGQRHPALLETAALRVHDAPVERRAEDRLRLHNERAQLAVLELAELLHAREQLLVAQMPLAEVPADDGAGDVLAVE